MMDVPIKFDELPLDVTPDNVYRVIRQRQHVSFVELTSGKYLVKEQACGQLGMISAEFPNIVFWPGCSDLLIDALVSLLKDKRIEVNAANFLVYLCDGEIPRMPIAKQARAYKKEHWLPVTFSTPKRKAASDV